MTFIERYREINGKHGKRLVFNLTHRGFCSEISNMALGVLYAMDHGYEFVLYSKRWVSSFSGEGWEDYFLPFCSKESRYIFYKKKAWPNGIKDRFWSKCIRMVFPNTITTHDIWGRQELWNDNWLDKKYEFPELEIQGDAFHVKKIILTGLFKMNRATLCQVAICKSRIELPERYIGLHIRRGDKVSGRIKERDAIEEDKYVKAVMEASNLKDIFLATDDYNVFLLLQERYKDYNFYTLCEPHRKGFDEFEYNVSSSDIKKKEVYSLLTDIYYLTKSEVFVGTYTSNIGQIVKNIRPLDKLSVSMEAEWRAY